MAIGHAHVEVEKSLPSSLSSKLHTASSKSPPCNHPNNTMMMMIPFPKLPLLLLSIALCSLFAFNASSESGGDRLSELLALQSQSITGIIHLNDQSVSRFLSSVETPRPYWVLIFFDVAHLHDRSELRLGQLLNEFAIAASSYIANNQEPSSPHFGKLFFCEIEFKESQLSFSRFGVNAIPHIRLIAPHQGLNDSDQLQQGDFSKFAETIAQFIEAKTKLVVGPIHRPPVLSRKQIIFIVIMYIISMPFFVKKILSGRTFLHDRKFWLAGSVFVYFFSVSGAMHNIIRSMPMFLVDRNDPSKLIFFYQGSGMQLGAEGFAVGSLYTMVGLLLAFMTDALVKVRNVSLQKLAMIFTLFVCFSAVKQVVYLDNWKTGYGIHAFWPSRWK